MSSVQSLLAVILVQHLVFGALWLGAAHLKLARRPAAHWAATAFIIVPATTLLMLRGAVPTGLSVGLGNLLLLLAMLALRRGVQRFCRVPATDGEHALLLGLGLCSVVGVVWGGPVLLMALLALGSAMAWTLLRAAGEVRSGLADEFGPEAATWCTVPLVLLACLILLRLAVGVLVPGRLSNYLGEPGGGGGLPVFGALVCALLLQVNLLLLVTLRLVRKLQHQSDHDMLTGLLSRRPMAERLEAELQRQQRQGGSFALLSIDIDHFKQINDAHGHAAGDAVLRRVAQALQATARRVDSVARMGGEEFAVLLPGADRDSAERAALRMLQAARRLEHPEIARGRGVSVSIGLAVASARGESVQSLQRRLDEALYRAKAAGRDGLQHAEEPGAAMGLQAAAA